MDRLSKIPSPPGHLVREFCHRALPLVAFLAAGLGTAHLWRERFAGSHEPIPVVSARPTDAAPLGSELAFVLPTLPENKAAGAPRPSGLATVADPAPVP